MRRIGFATFLAVLLVLALLFHGLSNDAEKDGRSPTGAIAQRNAAKEGTETAKGESKPTKASERPSVPVKKLPLAEPVPDRPGFVIHPVNGGIVDVRGIPAGLVVQESGVMFQIPKMGYVITADAFNKAVWNPSAVTTSLGDDGKPVLSIGGGDVPAVVSCHPAHWETRWDDGSPYVPDEEANGKPRDFAE